MTSRDSLRRAAEAAHVAAPLRHVRNTLVRWLSPDASQALTAATDRDLRDNAAIRLLLAFALRSNSSCIDVGAHEGLWLAEFRRLAPRGRHLAYEPLPHMHRDLAARFPDMEIRKAALSNSDGETSFVHVLDRDLVGYSGMRSRDYPREVVVENIRVKTERLDDHLPDGSKAQFPITRPIAPDPRRSSHLSPVPVRETLEQHLRLTV